MSGNVFEASGMVQTVFPIPMRGNELLAYLRGWYIQGKFPIPMRGNELARTWASRSMSFRFPIPMRGNEKAEIMAEHFSGPVPDPHEG